MKATVRMPGYYVGGEMLKLGTCQELIDLTFSKILTGNDKVMPGEMIKTPGGAD